jgi:4-diphosphocytidyl-2-C-methyl-D-erythritol kinase
MTLEIKSPCKVNLLLNILGRRPDGYHELETVLQPVALHDVLRFERRAGPLQLTCNLPGLPVDSKNLAHRSAEVFLNKAGIQDGVRIHLEKNIPLAAGLGGGSGNAAATLLGLNELFGRPLSGDALQEMAAALGSDVPFFLQSGPALATGRGENIQALDSFPALRGRVFLLVHPGFGISTAWAYANLSRFPAALRGQPGRASKLVTLLQSGDMAAAGAAFYNSLEAPAHAKYPWLAAAREFLRANGASAALMSGSGSTTFALSPGRAAAEELAAKFKNRFGDSCWTAIVPVE